MTRRALAITAIAAMAVPAITSGSSAGSAPAAVAGSARYLNAVSCATPTACFAVGTTFVGPRASPVVTLTQRWNGKRWTTVPSPNPEGAKNSQLVSVSCANANDCFAVGQSAPVYNHFAALVEHWDGKKWSVVPTPTPDGATVSWLTGVSCASATFCAAVGSQGVAGRTSLIEMWNGTAWSIVPSHNLGPVSYLYGVSCRSTANCFTVGEYVTAGDGDSQPYTERWDGKTWTVVPSATNIRNLAASGVSCPDATTCMAVGAYGSAPIAERWNGKRWSSLPALSPGPQGGRLSAVSCVRQTYCFAAGRYGLAGSALQAPLLERWNGNKWAIVAGPRPAAKASGNLFGISCATTTSCFAVGSTTALNAGFYGPNHPLIERFDGKKWAIVPSPS